MSCFENFDKIIILVFYIGKNNNNVGVPYGFPYQREGFLFGRLNIKRSYEVKNNNLLSFWYKWRGRLYA